MILCALPEQPSCKLQMPKGSGQFADQLKKNLSSFPSDRTRQRWRGRFRRSLGSHVRQDPGSCGNRRFGSAYNEGEVYI